MEPITTTYVASAGLWRRVARLAQEIENGMEPFSRPGLPAYIEGLCGGKAPGTMVIVKMTDRTHAWAAEFIERDAANQLALYGAGDLRWVEVATTVLHD